MLFPFVLKSCQIFSSNQTKVSLSKFLTYQDKTLVAIGQTDVYLNSLLNPNKNTKICLARKTFSAGTISNTALYHSLMLNILAFRTSDVGGFLVFGVPNAKILALGTPYASAHQSHKTTPQSRNFVFFPRYL